MAMRMRADYDEIGVQNRHLVWLAVPLLTVLIVLQYKLWLGQSGYVEAMKLERSISALDITNRALEERNNDLKQRISDLHDRDVAMEGVARRELGWVKPDETFFMVVDYTD